MLNAIVLNGVPFSIPKKRCEEEHTRGDYEMRISLMDRSLYLKGLMLLIRKDREIRDEEKDMILRIGAILGFEKKFCECTISEILDNRYVVDEPPQFSRPEVARSFVKDGMRVALADGELHEWELGWLKTVAQANGVADDALYDPICIAWDRAERGTEDSIDAEGFEWE
jgi:hypothetical protein